MFITEFSVVLRTTATASASCSTLPALLTFVLITLPLSQLIQDGNTGLINAAAAGHLDVVTLLLYAGADIDHSNYVTAIMTATDLCIILKLLSHVKNSAD